MLEARTFLKEIDYAKKILEENGAIFKGEYICHDFIFSSIDKNISIQDEFLRLRINKKNIWEGKDVILAIKITEQKSIGKNSIIKIRKEFDTESEAILFIENNYKDLFEFDFEFTRTGWQYDLGLDQIDLERLDDMSDCYSIEIKSDTEEGLFRLKEMLNIKDTIKGPTALEIKKILGK